MAKFTPMTIAALEKAIDLLGTQDRLADALGIRSPSIAGWRRRGKVPADRCRAIEDAVGGGVTRYELRPDVFGDEPVRAEGEGA